MNNDNLINFRIPSTDVEKIGKLVPSEFRNRSVMMRAAVQLLMKKYGIEPSIK
jgi:Arc/MetJ-type ribon-helix-helix transcriptional regulator